MSEDKLPTEDELAELPPALVVAYAAACAERKLVLLDGWLPFEGYSRVIEAIAVARTVAKSERDVLVANRFSIEAIDAANAAANIAYGKDTNEKYYDAIIASVNAARAAYNAISGATPAVYAENAARAATSDSHDAAAARGYFERLKELATTSGILNIDIPIWPNGEPEWSLELKKKGSLADAGAKDTYLDKPTMELLVDPGSASPEDLSEFFYEVSKLYRMMGGPGIDFRVDESREPCFEEVV